LPNQVIFRDEEPLSPNWKVPPYRVEQTEMLWSLYGDILDERGSFRAAGRSCSPM
jgi:hypothetical protein